MISIYVRKYGPSYKSGAMTIEEILQLVPERWRSGVREALLKL